MRRRGEAKRDEKRRRGDVDVDMKMGAVKSSWHTPVRLTLQRFYLQRRGRREASLLCVCRWYLLYMHSVARRTCFSTRYGRHLGWMGRIRVRATCEGTAQYSSYGQAVQVVPAPDQRPTQKTGRKNNSFICLSELGWCPRPDLVALITKSRPSNSGAAAVSPGARAEPTGSQLWPSGFELVSLVNLFCLFVATASCCGLGGCDHRYAAILRLTTSFGGNLSSYSRATGQRTSRAVSRNTSTNSTASKKGGASD